VTRTGLVALAFAGVLATAAEARVEGEKDGVRYAIAARTPDQMAAFYEARGFPPAAIDALANACFFTVTLTNQGQNRIWLELGRWTLRDAGGGLVERITRADWKARWERVGLPAAQRSTFGWTLLPEVRDLHPAEPVGGNLTVTPTTRSLVLTARLPTGARKEGREIVIEIPGLRCEGRKS
jgi:hypothetical protein